MLDFFLCFMELELLLKKIVSIIKNIVVPLNKI